MGDGSINKIWTSKYYEYSCWRHVWAHHTHLDYSILTAHWISWFAVNSANYKFFTGKVLTSNLILYPSHAVLRWFSDFTILKVAHHLIDNSQLKCFQKEKNKPSHKSISPTVQFFLSWVLNLTTGTGSLKKKNLFSNHNIWETKHTPET